MKAYLTYFKLKFISGLQYRTAAYAGIATQFFFGLVYIMVYIAFYKSGGKDAPMSLPQVISYLWLNQAFFALINQFTKDSELFKLIREGGISYEFIRPKDLYFMWYFKIVGQKLSYATLRFLPLIIVAFLLPSPYRLLLPESFSRFILFLLSLCIGTLLVTAITTLYPILTLVTMNEKGITSIIVAIADILSGTVVPISFFPTFLRRISKWLPFQYVSDLPFQIYVGSISFQDAFTNMLIQTIWLILLIIIGKIIMKWIMKRVTVQGG